MVNTKKRDKVGRDMLNSIATRRKELGMSQTKLADLVGVKPSTIGGFEKNKYIPNVRTAALICEALECSFEEIFFLMPF